MTYLRWTGVAVMSVSASRARRASSWSERVARLFLVDQRASTRMTKYMRITGTYQARGEEEEDGGGVRRRREGGEGGGGGEGG